LGCSSVVEGVLVMCKALGSIPNTKNIMYIFFLSVPHFFGIPICACIELFHVVPQITKTVNIVSLFSAPCIVPIAISSSSPTFLTQRLICFWSHPIRFHFRCCFLCLELLFDSFWHLLFFTSLCLHFHFNPRACQAYL
jgi:hypothetical protein